MKKALLIIIIILTHCFCLWSQADKSVIQNIIFEKSDEIKLSKQELKNFEVLSNYTDSKSKVTYITLQQTMNGLKIHHALIQISIKENGTIANIHSSFIKLSNLKTNLKFQSKPQVPLEKAISHLNIEFNQTNKIKRNKDLFQVSMLGLKQDALLEKILYYKNEKEIVSAWRVELQPKSSSDWWVIIVADEDGMILDKYNYTLYCSHESITQNAKPNYEHNCTDESDIQQTMDATGAYKVFPFPVESPIFGERSLEIDAADNTASPYGWHDTNGQPGAEYTITRGNNVYVYEDANDNDIPGYSPNGGSNLNFNFPYDFTSSPLQNRDAALTNLFYWNNFIHDALYAYGFDETSGNFQRNNYGKGGLQNDHVMVEGQDGGGTNNANFSTPPDGFTPKMQVYLWYPSMGNFLKVLSPESIAGGYSGSMATFGPDVPEIPITAEIVMVSDGSNNPTLGCNTLVNANQLQGKIAMFDRGTCTFVSKVLNAQNAGAVAVIIVNNLPNGVLQMGGTSNNINIPVIMISLADGNTIKAQLPGVIAEFGGNALGQVYDCAFDNGVVAHEYGHGISTRLTGGPMVSTCLSNREQMGEGWSDFFSLVFTHLPEQTANTPRGIGNFVSGANTDGGGIRTYPYSRDMAINPHTYSAISSLSVPHGVGSVWCAMLWDLYWNMTDLFGFDPDIINGNGGNNKAIRLVIEGMKLQACQPGFVNGRDAILLADEILYDGIHNCIIWKTFARRGLGISANQGSSNNVLDGNQAFDFPEDCNSNSADFVIPNNNKVCVGSSITLQDISIPVADTRSWEFPNGNPNASNAPNPTVVFDTPGNYDILLNINNSLGNSTITKTINVMPLPEFEVAVNAAWNGENGSAGINILNVSEPFSTIFNTSPSQQTNEVYNLTPGEYSVTLTDANGCSSTNTFTIDNKVGISQIESDLVTIYPNPSSNGLFNISIENKYTNELLIDVLDISGRRILRTQTNNEAIFEIDLSEFANGLYFVKVNMNGQQVLKKLMLLKK
jgi:hypothetical protein